MPWPHLPPQGANPLSSWTPHWDSSPRMQTEQPGWPSACTRFLPRDRGRGSRHGSEQGRGGRLGVRTPSLCLVSRLGLLSSRPPCPTLVLLPGGNRPAAGTRGAQGKARGHQPHAPSLGNRRAPAAPSVGSGTAVAAPQPPRKPDLAPCPPSAASLPAQRPAQRLSAQHASSYSEAASCPVRPCSACPCPFIPGHSRGRKATPAQTPALPSRAPCALCSECPQPRPRPQASPFGPQESLPGLAPPPCQQLAGWSLSCLCHPVTSVLASSLSVPRLLGASPGWPIGHMPSTAPGAW